MQKPHIKKITYAIRHDYLTFNNLVILVAFLIAASWVWGSLQAMQRNFDLQRDLDQKNRSLQVTQLQRDSLELQKRYYQTEEYQELAARESLGLVMNDEKILILPPNSEAAKADGATGLLAAATLEQTQSSNLEQWVNFLFGGYSRGIGANDAPDDE